MNVLARFDPGDAVTGPLLIVLLQTSVVILLAALLSRAVFRHRAEARHVLWLGALVLVVISPALAAIASRSGVAVWVIALPVVDNEPNRAAENRGSSDDMSHADASWPVGESTDDFVAAETAPLHKAMEKTLSRPAQSAPSRAVTPELNQRGSALMGGLTLQWAIGALAVFARLAAGWRLVEALSRSTRMIDPVRHGPVLERVRTALGIAALPPVLTSPTVCAPVAVGLLSPRVIVPEGLAESLESDSLRDVLFHECAHVIRLDAWVGLLQRLAGTLFWPHPLVQYANGQLTRAREEVCDNHALRCGDAPGYARTLLALTEKCLPLSAIRPGLGLIGARWTL